MNLSAMSPASLIPVILAQPLLALALASITAVLIGGLLRHLFPLLGSMVRGIGNIGLFGALLLTVMQAVSLKQGIDLPLDALGMPRQQVTGGETRVPMARDGHFWITARVNGVTHRFLVDTGATVTAIPPSLADEAGVEPQPMRQSVLLRTANGTIPARLGTIAELRFGNVVARDLDAVIAPGMEQTSVLGMNFLSRLGSWRVEDDTLIITPRHPQKPAASDS